MMTPGIQSLPEELGEQQENVLEAQLAQLRAKGADQYDPVRWQFMMALLERACSQRDNVRKKLLVKASNALAQYQQVLSELPQVQQGEPVPTQTQPPPTCEGLQLLTQYIGSVEIGASPQDMIESLGAFNAQLQQQDQALKHRVPSHAATADKSSLKSSFAYQQRREKQRVEDFVDQALRQTPENPGPLNPEVLVIKMVQQIYSLSPDYISRYMGYFETLQWLEKERI